MLATTAETTVRRLRAILAIIWLCLIGSLALTPERIGGADSLRLFWSVVIPLLPLILLVGGHGAWRRICPLSHLSQLPRYFGIQRRVKCFNRETGKLERKLALLKPNGFVRRNHDYIQFGFLFFGIVCRIAWANWSPLALAALLLGVILSSIAVGYFFGGKTWCHYFCPIAPVQQVFTGPAGLFEEKACRSRLPIVQSMCRSPGRISDSSACVGCRGACPDIDRERNYWDELARPSKRIVYFCYPGLILGFGFYFALLGGSWNYFLSGAYTKLGFGNENYIVHLADGLSLSKTPAAILILLASVTLSFAVGAISESILRAVSQALGRNLDDERRQHLVYSFSTFFSFNLFYLFLAHGVIHRLSDSLIGVLEWSAVTLSTVWLVHAVGKSSEQHRREGLAAGLVAELKRLAIPLAPILGTRSLNDLSANEVYVLAKSIPGIERQQRLNVFREMLSHAFAAGISIGDRNSPFLSKLRAELEVTETEFEKILIEIRPDLIDTGDSTSASSKLDRADQLASPDLYRASLRRYLLGRLKAGAKIREAVESIASNPNIVSLQSVHKIDSDQHQEMLNAFLQDPGYLVDGCGSLVKQLVEETKAIHCLSLYQSVGDDPGGLLQLELVKRQSVAAIEIIAIANGLTGHPHSLWLAQLIHLICGETAIGLLDQRCELQNSYLLWRDFLEPSMVSAIEKGVDLRRISCDPSLPRLPSFPDLLAEKVSLEQCLKSLVEVTNETVAALALRVLWRIDNRKALFAAKKAAVKSGVTGQSLLALEIERILSQTKTGKIKSDDHSVESLTVPKANSIKDYGGEFASSASGQESRDVIGCAAIIARTALFSSTSLPALLRLGRQATFSSVRGGTVLLNVGEGIGELNIVLEGEVLRTSGGRAGKEAASELLNAYEVIEPLALAGSYLSESAYRVASTRAWILKLELSFVRRVINADPSTSARLLELYNEQLQVNAQRHQSQALVRAIIDQQTPRRIGLCK